MVAPDELIYVGTEEPRMFAQLRRLLKPHGCFV
jgi:hypothetical protein